MKTTFQVQFNKSTFDADSIEEANKIASNLIESSMPFAAKIIELDQNGDFIQTIKTVTA